MVKPILATTLVAVAAASISSQVAVAATEALGGSHQEEEQRQLWGGLGWPSSDDDDNNCNPIVSALARSLVKCCDMDKNNPIINVMAIPSEDFFSVAVRIGNCIAEPA